MAKSLEETLKDLRAGGYSEGGIRNWLVNKGFPSVKVDKAMALRTAKDSVSGDLRAKRDKIREARVALYNAANHEGMRHKNPAKYAELERTLEKLIDDYGRTAPDDHDSSARDSSDRRSRLHRALDCMLDSRRAAKDTKEQKPKWDGPTGRFIQPDEKKCHVCHGYGSVQFGQGPGSVSRCPACGGLGVRKK
jgi:DnaJ-class molecular chaperone